MDKRIVRALTEAVEELINDPPSNLPLWPEGSDPAALEAALIALRDARDEIEIDPLPGEEPDTVEDALNEEERKYSMWMSAFANLAGTIFGEFSFLECAVNEMIARIVLKHWPSVGAFMLANGILFRHNCSDPANPVPPGSEDDYAMYSIDWPRVAAFMRDPRVELNEAAIDNLFPPGADAGEMLGKLAALWVMAPKALAGLSTGDLKVAALGQPPVLSDPLSGWGRYRRGASQWISQTIPQQDKNIEPPEARYPADRFELRPDREPDISTTIAIRSARYPGQAGPDVNDFEFWFYFNPDLPQWEWAFKGSKLQITPAIALGLAWDGDTRTWHGIHATDDPNSPLLPSGYNDPVKVEIVPDVPAGEPQFSSGRDIFAALEIYDIRAYFHLFNRDARSGTDDASVFVTGLQINDIRLNINLGILAFWNGFFVSEETAKGINFDIELGKIDLNYTPNTGLQIDHAGGLAKRYAINWYPGIDFTVPIFGWKPKWKQKVFKINSLLVAFDFDATQDDGMGARAIVSLNFSLHLGPLWLTTDGLGWWYGRWLVTDFPNTTSEMKSMGMVWPSGAGLTLEWGPVTGGGFLYWRDPRNPERTYIAGLLNLQIKTLQIFALAVYEKMPDGNTSFIAMLGARWEPGIPLPWGLILKGVGGLFGFNRAVDTDAVRKRLKSSAIGNVLMVPQPNATNPDPRDIVENAPVIMDDIASLFPPANGVHIFGPVLRLNWLKFIDIDMVLLVEIATTDNFYGQSGLTKIVAIGVGSIVREVAGKPLIQLYVNGYGELNLIEGFLEFEAKLLKKSEFGQFKVSGDGAARFSTGHGPYGMASLGGFHPRFKVEPARFSKMKPIKLTKKGQLGIWKISAFGYLAVTTSSVQLGGGLEAKLKASKFEAVGTIQIDVLLIIYPLHFDLSFTAKFQVKVWGKTLAGIKISGGIWGPGRWRVWGEFSINLLFFDLSWSGCHEWGDVDPELPTGSGVAIDDLEPELDKPENIRTHPKSGDRSVIAKETNVENGLAVVSPTGRLIWSQTRAPLDVTLDRFEGSPLNEPQALVITSPDAANQQPVREYFSPVLFADMDESEALNRNTFEHLESGLAFGFDEISSAPIGRNLTVNIFTLPRPDAVLVDLMVIMPQLILEGIMGRAATPATFARKPAAIGVHNAAWKVVDKSGDIVADTISEFDAHQRARHGGLTAVRSKDIVDLGNL